MDIKTEVIDDDCLKEPNKQETIVHNILEKCREETACNKLKVPLHDYIGRTEHYTGLPRSHIFTLQEMRKKYNSGKPFDVLERLIIIKTLLKCYTSKHSPFPSVSNIYDTLKVSLNLTDVSHFYYKLTEMGFDYRKTKTGHILAEDMKLAFERYNYLKKIRKHKSFKTNIYYLDERVIDSSLQFPKPDFNKISNTENATHLFHGYYMYHILTEKGLQYYLFTNKKCKDTYMMWIFDVLIKVMIPGSVIVIDDHPLHGKLLDEPMTRYNSKSDMINWLKRNNIPCNITMHKAELFELIRKFQKPQLDYDFDRLLKSHGFDVLRLPFGCRNLSPSTLLWQDLAAKMFSVINEYTPLELEEKIVPALSALHWSSWKELMEKISNWEDQFFDLNTKTEDILENICAFDVHNS